MKDDLFATLPQEIIREEILSRVPIRSIRQCRLVCKSWRHLIETSYTPKQGLAFPLPNHKFRVYNEAFRPRLQVSLPCPKKICSTTLVDVIDVIDSANGLLWYACTKNLFVCNPMTREYVVLPPLPIPNWSVPFYGVGAGKISGQYKILCGTYRFYSWSFYVYTLGGRGNLWRSIAVPALYGHRPAQCGLHEVAPFLNGNLHCLTSNPEKKNVLLHCIDLETEVLTSFSFSFPDRLQYSKAQLCILEDRLCLCLSDTSDSSRIAIWRMITYGDMDSWSKEYTIDLPHKYGHVYPLKVLAKGDLLFAVELSTELFIYSKNTKTIVTKGPLKGYCGMLSRNIYFYSPNFLSLRRTLGIHNVRSLKDNIFPDL